MSESRSIDNARTVHSPELTPEVGQVWLHRDGTTDLNCEVKIINVRDSGSRPFDVDVLTGHYEFSPWVVSRWQLRPKPGEAYAARRAARKEGEPSSLERTMIEGLSALSDALERGTVDRDFKTTYVRLTDDGHAVFAEGSFTQGPGSALPLGGKIKESGDKSMSITCDPEPGLYRHNATNSFYVVLGVGSCSTNGPRERIERSVVYYSLSRREIKYREVAEFVSPGRFTRVDALPIPEAAP